MAKIENFRDEIKNFTNKELCVLSEYYHVVLLIDKSSSMLFPYLDDKDNVYYPDSADYKNAAYKTQVKMIEAHKKALDALRGSALCNKNSLLIHQYTFNSAKKRLDEAVELYEDGYDKVTKLTFDNYYPYNGTALYNSIHDAINLVYNGYLVKSMEAHSRIDKLVIGVITDGEDTVLTDEEFRRRKIREIRDLMKKLRNKDNKASQYQYLAGSVLIGLTSSEFTENKLKEVKKELDFENAISIDKADEKSIRNAFKLWSVEASTS